MTTYYTPPHVLDPAAGSSGYLADIVANPPFEAEPTVTNRPLTWCEVCGCWYDGPEENHWHSIILDWVHHDSETIEQRPTWRAPVITRLDVTRTMAWCGSGGDSHD